LRQHAVPQQKRGNEKSYQPLAEVPDEAREMKKHCTLERKKKRNIVSHTPIYSLWPNGKVHRYTVYAAVGCKSR